MPKQILKIDQFHGGLSSNSDPRDIADNELSAATDVMVDELGRIRTMGGTAVHESNSSTALAINPGYGLFHFAHDRIGGHLGEHLAEGDFASHDKWTGGGVCVDTGGNLTFTFGSDTLDGTATQTYGNRLELGIGGITYAFTYTVAVTTAPDFFTLAITTFPASTTSLPFTAGTHTVTFVSHADAATKHFIITGTDDVGGTTTQGVFSIDNVSLYIYDAAETGDDYLALADNESTDPAIYIYSKNEDAWSESQTITLGETTGLEANFYYVDGALRISDGNFGIENLSQWHGYIKNTWFPNIGSGFSIDQWYRNEQRILPPDTSYFQKDWVRTSGETTTSDTIPKGSPVTFASTGAHAEKTKSSIHTVFAAADDQTNAVVRCVAGFEVASAFGSTNISLTLKVGFWNDNGDGVGGPGVWSPYAQEVLVLDHVTNSGAKTYFPEFSFDAAVTDTDDANLPGGGGDDYFRIEVISFTLHSGTSLGFITVLDSPIYEGTTTSFPALDSGGPFTNGYSTGNNVCMLWSWDGAFLDAVDTSWVPADNAGLWGIGATFIYDGVQESQLTELLDESDNSIGGMSLVGLDGGDLVTENRPAIVIAIADPSHDGDGNGDGTIWNKRVTGCNIYLKDMYAAGIEGDVPNAWILQYSANFLTGKLRVESTQAEFDASFQSDPTNQSYYYWFLNTTHSTSPSVVTSYEMNTGYDSTSEDYVSAYKTAVVANRIVYIGNVQVTKSDNSKEILGDAMIKSLVGKLDAFPMSRLIEASIRDGDNIVKLEEYADRILQFKKNKMHIINVSQEIEFLEDTFMHKGVSHPAAVCKTDFGIAWVNKLGCYLYDGQTVKNLLEKGGRQIIKESDWATFTANEPMIGYIPKKRQLLIVDDNSDTGYGKTFLYDIVTQSWVKGSNGTITSNDLTNFVTDWNGDLIYAHTAGTVLKWVDDLADATVSESSAVDINTKDYDFGYPGQRKKVYRVRISYKGDADTLAVKYTVNGDTNNFFGFEGTTWSDGVGTPSGSLDPNPLRDASDLTYWHHAELKPSTLSEASNIYSFQLHMNGTADDDFEINDISIVYRLKPVK